MNTIINRLLVKQVWNEQLAEIGIDCAIDACGFTWQVLMFTDERIVLKGLTGKVAGHIVETSLESMGYRVLRSMSVAPPADWKPTRSLWDMFNAKPAIAQKGKKA